MDIAVSTGILVSIRYHDELGRYRIGLGQKQLPSWTPGEVGLGKVIAHEYVGNGAGERVQPGEIQSGPVGAGGLTNLRDAEVGVAVAHRHRVPKDCRIDAIVFAVEFPASDEKD